MIFIRGGEPRVMTTALKMRQQLVVYLPKSDDLILQIFNQIKNWLDYINEYIRLKLPTQIDNDRI